MDHGADRTDYVEARWTGHNSTEPLARTDATLAEIFGHGVALIDRQGNVDAISSRAQLIAEEHPAFLPSGNRLNLASATKARGLREALAQEGSTVLRIDDGCMDWPLALNIRPWQDHQTKLVVFMTPRLDLPGPDFLAGAFDVSARQRELLGHFAAGSPLAEIAAGVGLRPQSVREIFSQLYVQFGVRNQLELLRFLASLPQGDGA